MKMLSVVGARPQFVKLAPVSAAAQRARVEHVVVHTGQHYDKNMSDGFFEDLEIPEPDVNLGIGSGSHGAQTGAMLGAMDPILEKFTPDWVLVYGDTNSTIAGALSAVKLNIPVAHLEAGLRSFNRRMPEEHNRVLTDHASDLCLAPTQAAADRLAVEGLAERTRMVGDVMTDVLLQVARRVRTYPVESPIGDATDFVLATLHRPDNTDDPERLAAVLDSLASLDRTVFLPVHPRLEARCQEHGITLERGAIKAIDPLGYPQLVQALQGAHAVVTDSGGLQKEAFMMGVPTTTIRTETEWRETLADAWNVLEHDPTKVRAAVEREAPTTPRGNPYGTGDAADQAIAAIQTWKI
jgi:UDP-N-acetylglucosamine 2-epimerase (non-hydrolysing)